MMIIYWEKTKILSVKEVKEGLCWLLAVRGSLVANGEGKLGKIHNTGGINRCFERLNVWEQP